MRYHLPMGRVGEVGLSLIFRSEVEEISGFPVGNYHYILENNSVDRHLNH